MENKLWRGILIGAPISLGLWALILWPCFGQESPPAAQQALSNQLLSQLNSTLACSTALIEAQAKIKSLEAELKSKPQPKKE